MNKEERLRKIQEVNYFIASCLDAKDEPPDGLTYQDVAKIVSERYATQNVETVKVFFRTKGSRSNNKPYTYPYEMNVGTANIISDDLLEIRTNRDVGYGNLEPIIDEDLKPI